MSAAGIAEYPSITVTKAGVAVALPIAATPQRDGTWRPTPVARNPKISFPPPVAIGEGSVRRNYDIDEVIFTTWQGGMGEDTYAAATNPSSFQTSRCETRFPGVLTSRPLATQLGAPAFALGRGTRVVELGYTNARLLLYARGLAAYRLNGAAWAAIQNGGVNLAVYQHALGLNGVYVVADKGGTYGVFRSVDGATWDSMAVGAMTAPVCCAEFDTRLFALNSVLTGAGSAARWQSTVYASTDIATAAAGAGTWTAGNGFSTPNPEVPVKLFTWLYPPDKGRTTLWCLTSARLYYYDYYAATPAWVEWFRFRNSLKMSNPTAGVDAVVHSGTNNLYVCIGDKHWTWEFTGATITRHGPNKRGGLPAGTQLQVEVLAEDGQQLFGFATPGGDATSAGAAVSMADGGAWHHLWDRTGTVVQGGGAGESSCWVALGNQSTGFTEVWELDNWDLQVLPQHATGRSYEAGLQVHKTAWINGGLANVNKRVLYAEVDCIRAGGVTGLPTGATVEAFVVTRNSSTILATDLGTLTDASTFPAVLALAGGYGGKEFQIWLYVTRGTAASAAPIVKALKVGYRPRPKQRYTYTVRVDVRDECPAFQTPNGQFKGHSAAWLRQWLDELNDNDDAGQDDPLVAFAYGGEHNSRHPRYRSIPQAEVLTQSQESPDKADGLYLLSFNDVSAPTSG